LTYLDEIIKGKLNPVTRLLFFIGACSVTKKKEIKGLNKDRCYVLNRLLAQSRKYPSQFQGKKNEFKNTYIIRKTKNLLDRTFDTPIAKSLSKRVIDDDFIESIKYRTRIPKAQVLKSLLKTNIPILLNNKEKSHVLKSILPRVKELAKKKRKKSERVNEKSLMFPLIGIRKSFITSFNLIKK